MWHNFSVLCGGKKALIMWRMRMLANYVELHHCILSDALSWNPRALKFLFISRKGYPKTLLQAHTLRTLESVPLEPKSPPTFIRPAPGKHFEKAAGDIIDTIGNKESCLWQHCNFKSKTSTPKLCHAILT